jgi:hypothetical protein
MTFARDDPLVANGWIYGYDPEALFTEPVATQP